MASINSVEVDIELKSHAEKFWTAMKNSTTVFLKALPNQYKSIDVLEGDGKSVGSVLLINYQPGSPITRSKEKIERFDEEKKAGSYVVIDGDLLKFFKSFKTHFVVSPKCDGSVMKWSCEFENLTDEIRNTNAITDSAVKNFQDLDAYVFAGNDIQ